MYKKHEDLRVFVFFLLNNVWKNIDNYTIFWNLSQDIHICKITYI